MSTFFGRLWDALNTDPGVWFSNLANFLQILQGLLVPVATAVIGYILLKIRRQRVRSKADGMANGSDVPKKEPPPDEPPPEHPVPVPAPAVVSTEENEALYDGVLHKYELLLTKFTPGKKFAVRSLQPPPPVSFGLLLFFFWAEATTFMFVLAAAGPRVALGACALISIYLYFRWDHGTVIEINYDARHVWVMKEYGGYGGGIWPPHVGYDISWDNSTKLFCATVTLQDFPIVRGTHARRDRLEKKFKPLVLFLRSIANLPPGKRWHVGWLN